MRRDFKQEQLGLEFAELKKTQAEDKANRDSPGWSDLAMWAIRAYAYWNEYFRIEDVRKWAYKDGFVPAAENDRAWAGPTTRAIRNGYMVGDSYVPSSESKGHAQPKRVYRSLLYRQVA